MTIRFAYLSSKPRYLCPRRDKYEIIAYFQIINSYFVSIAIKYLAFLILFKRNNQLYDCCLQGKQKS